MSRPSCTESVIETLGNYLKANMPSLCQVLYEFPAPNVKLKYPSISILAGNPTFTPMMPEVWEISPPDSSHRVITQRIIGAYDFNLQLDLWTRDKPERTSVYEEFFAAFNDPNSESAGLALEMNNYYGVWTRYDLSGYKLDDTEQSSQRSEWRVKMNVLANTRAVQLKTDFAIETIENVPQLTDTDIS